MKLCRMIPLLGLATLSAATAFPLRDKPDVFFKPGPETPAGLSATTPYPRGSRFFFCLAGEPNPAQQAKARALGVSLLGPEGKDNASIGCTVGIDRREGELVYADAASLEKELQTQLSPVAANPAITFWNLKPGSFNSRIPKERTYLQVASRTIEKLDPLKRPIWTFIPAEANTAVLSRMAPWISYLGKSLEITPPKDGNRLAVLWNMERAVEAIHETTAQSTPVATLVQMPARDAAELQRFVRHDLYLSFLTGAKGVISLPSANEQKGAFLDAVLAIAEELLGEKEIGPVLLFGEPREDLQVDVVDGPTELETVLPDGSATRYATVSHRDLAYGKNRYLLLVNSANAPVTVMIGGMPYNAVNAENLLAREGIIPVAEGEFECDLKPLEVKLFRLTRR